MFSLFSHNAAAKWLAQPQVVARPSSAAGYAIMKPYVENVLYPFRQAFWALRLLCFQISNSKY